MKRLARSEASRREFRAYGIHVVRQPVRVVAECPSAYLARFQAADAYRQLVDARKAG